MYASWWIDEQSLQSTRPSRPRKYFTSQLCLLTHILIPPLNPFPFLPQLFFRFGCPLIPGSLGILICSSQETQDLVNLFLSQLNTGIYRVTDPVQESLGRVCGLNVADPGFLEEPRATRRQTVFGHTMGTKVGTESGIGPGEVGSRTTTVVLVPERW